MKVKTDFYQDVAYWNAVGKILHNNEPNSYDLLYENHGSMIAVAANYSFVVYIQVGSWTLEYQIQ